MIVRAQIILMVVQIPAASGGAKYHRECGKAIRSANTKRVIWSQISPPTSRKTNSIRGPQGGGILSPNSNSMPALDQPLRPCEKGRFLIEGQGQREPHASTTVIVRKE